MNSGTSRQSDQPHLKCSECGTALSGGSPDTPCSGCLLKLGLSASQGDSESKMQPTAAHIGASNEEAASFGDLAALFPKLEILHMVARGGMGDVYCARQTSLNRLVALKIIRPEVQASAGFADRFAREANALAALNHTNIVTVYDFGQVADTHYFIMEYIDGINLRQMLSAGKLHPRQALEIVPSICDALQFAHNNGIVHRDIKPENIMVDTTGHVKIADFGLAKLLGKKTEVPALTKANQVMGTMHYMAPEQFERPLDVDHRADIYSLGVVIYELLTGELPLGRFAPPSQKVSLDARLDEVVLQSLQKEPSLRYQRVSELKSDMHAIGDSIKRRPIATTDAAQSSANPHTASPPLPGPIPDGGFIAAAADSQTYRNLLYLLLSIPLGLFYFAFLVIGLSLGLTTVIVWVGLFVFLGTFLAVKGLTEFERMLAHSLLRTSIPSRVVSNSVEPTADRTVLQKARDLMVSREGWAGIGYLLVKFPVGLITLFVTGGLLSLSIGLILMPILERQPAANLTVGSWKIDTPFEAALLSAGGFVLLFFSLHIFNGMAWLHAAWAKLCLRRLPR
ncbi:MAG: protein kinase [Planctomycetaceae bacterium]